MTIRDRIFDKLAEMEMTQKEFAKRTGIPETTVSDWKKKKTNPTAEKILIICKVLDVSPEWLLSGVETHGTRSNPASIIAVDVRTDAGLLLETYSGCDAAMQARILGYAQAMSMTRIKGKELEKSLSKEEIRELEDAEHLEPVSDADCPFMTEEQLKEFKRINL